LWDPYTVALNHYYEHLNGKADAIKKFKDNIEIPVKHHLVTNADIFKCIEEKRLTQLPEQSNTKLLPFIQYQTWTAEEKNLGGFQVLYKEPDSIPRVDFTDMRVQGGHSFISTNKHLDILVFKVTDENVTKSISLVDKKNDIIGYFAIALEDVREGYRVVPLKGEHGALLDNGNLLVYIKKRDY